MFNKNLKIFPILNKHLIEDRLETTYVFFATLKKSHDSHFSFKTKYGISKMSSIMGCNNSTMRRQLKKMFELNWVYVDANKKDIRFRSNKFILAQFGLSEKSKGFNIPYIGRETKYALHQTVINSNLEQQKFRFKEKLGTMGKSISKLYDVNPTQCMEVIEKERHSLNFSLNDDFTLSRRGIARLVNRKSVTTGKNTIKRLSKIGLVKTDVNRLIRVEELQGKNYKGNFDSSIYTSVNGEVFMQLPNKVELNAIQSLWDLVNKINQDTKSSFSVSYKSSFVDNIIDAMAYAKEGSELLNELTNKGFNLDNTYKNLECLKTSNYLYTIYYNKSIINNN